MSEMAFDRASAIEMIVRRVSMLSNENLLKLIMLDVNTPIEVNETIELAQFTPVREMTEKTRKSLDEALKEAEDPNNLIGPFHNADDFMRSLLSK